jgi:hypothetical protein
MKSAALDRVAFSPGEFASLFGKSQTWGYRQIYAGKVKTVTELGRILIPAAEVERVLGKAGAYNGLKPKVLKGGQKLNAWRRFIAERRKPKAKAITARASLDKLRHSGSDARKVALQRLGRRNQA